MTAAGTRTLAGRIRRHRVAIAVLAALPLAALWVALRRGGGQEEEVAAVVDVGTARAEIRELPVVLQALGTVEARPGSEAQLAAPGATRVARIQVALGDRVDAGQPLVVLDGSVWAVQADGARAGLETARQAHDRAQRLVREGVAPRKEEEAAAADLARAQAVLAEAQRTQSLGVLRSPIRGVVTAMRAHLGQAVDASEPLVQVVDPSGLAIRFHLSPDEAAQVAPGATVQLTSGSDSSATVVGSGEVRGVSAAVDSTTGSVEVRATISAPLRVLRVGESVSGLITVRRIKGAVVVPAAALLPAEDSGSQVFVVDAERVAHATPVVIGVQTGNAVQILSGLRGGETVVTEGAYGVTEGAIVRAGSAP